MSALELAPGPVVLDVAGQALSDEDRRRLRHPLVGGVILFARNYATPEQVAALTAEIRALRAPRLLISVDHEGGRVQRFRQGGYTALPPMASLGRLWDVDREQARAAARAAGVLIGAELAASGVDLSFTPVLDLAYGHSTAIGDRAFHRDPEAVAVLAGELMQGLKAQGMAAVGKHFPGHGHVVADSHLEVPVDERSFAAIDAADLMPYRRLIPLGLDAVMPAHVIYPAVDARPAGFSRGLAAAGPARHAAVPWRHLQRRSQHGGRQRRGRHRRARARGAGSGLRSGARLQSARCRRRVAGGPALGSRRQDGLRA